MYIVLFYQFICLAHNHKSVVLKVFPVWLKSINKEETLVRAAMCGNFMI